MTDYTQQLSKIFQQLIVGNANIIVIDIDYYTEEKGFGIKGNTFTTNELHIDYLNFKPEVVWEVSDILLLWQSNTLENNTRWNKAIFTAYKNGHFEVKTWWDEDFQKELYPNG